MLTTEGLRNYVLNQIQDKLGEIPVDNVYFAEGHDNSVEGTYIFAKNDKYHVLFTEKGKIRSDVATSDEREVLWHAVGEFSFNIILDFAKRNQESGKDFRRALFAKETEIFALFGKDFEARKIAEIDEILKSHPYHDI